MAARGSSLGTAAKPARHVTVKAPAWGTAAVELTSPFGSRAAAAVGAAQPSRPQTSRSEAQPEMGTQTGGARDGRAERADAARDAQAEHYQRPTCTGQRAKRVGREQWQALTECKRAVVAEGHRGVLT